ncbi:ATP:cob(I)alamin adenosyltransferase [Candidatus Woesearchaeota archaeon]|nr:ATP:cob(I)alamin adenosyltransferase [Candidatus Woesearchaeota archaeon]
MVIYTKKGDQGYASTLKGNKIPKNHEIILITGKIDSLQSALDSTNVIITNQEIKKIIQKIQEKLWQTVGEISNQGLSEIIKKPITEQDITELEQHIDNHHPENTYFIRFTKETSTRINEARVRTRELETMLTKQLLENKIRPEIYKYINRLSDLLYALACKEEKS